jgi:hypothetical protein
MYRKIYRDARCAGRYPARADTERHRERAASVADIQEHWETA